MTREPTSKQQLRELRKFSLRHIKAEIISVVCILLVVEVLFFGNIAYGIKWISCRQQPVVLVDASPFVSFGASKETVTVITHPGFFEEKRSLIPDGHHLFCSFDGAMKQARQNVSGVEQNIIYKQ